jgi:sugar phosphate isomerase/epimerase
VTISLVAEARGGPFVFWDDFEAGCAKAAEIGFDAVELFAPGPDFISVDEVLGSVERHGLELAAVGTGAGMVLHGLSISDLDDGRRGFACDFVRSMIDFGAEMGVPAIVGSMQGKADGADTVEAARGRLAESLESLGGHAASKSVALLFEPLNRYESNLSNTLGDAVELIESAGSGNVKILADLFHANIEEADIAQAIRDAGDLIGHVHFADTNRCAMGMGHLDMGPIADALREIGYSGYVSAEVFAKPDSIGAAEQTKRSFDEYFG